MDAFEFLALAAELAVAITGFSGIIATFQFGGHSEIRRSDAVGLNLIVQLSIVGLFGFLMPLFLDAIGTEATIIWATASLIEVVSGLYIGVSIHMQMKGALGKRSSVIMINSLQFVGAAIVLTNLMNIAGFVFHHEPAPFLAASIWVMGLSSFLFARLLMRPVWRAVKRGTGKLETPRRVEGEGNLRGLAHSEGDEAAT